MFYNL